MDVQDDLSTYQGRLKTFTESWPFSKGKLTRQEMAKAGFFYLKGDCVQCYYCEKELDCWEEEDDAFVEHKNHAAYCPFVKMFSEPPNSVTVHQAIELEKDKLLLSLDRSFEKWLKDIKEVNEQGISKFSKEIKKIRKLRL
ncbi:baculoviral IAP repeat containing deterin [Rhodnius prolixus]|uniref:Putative inhibitor of apoptosis domain protein rhodnius neglectus n=2 Tax=Rhodnius TaxID=13248 RepID=A0A4P6D9I6_RHOPR